MLFKYDGFDRTRRKIKAKIEATNLSEAKAKLKARKIIYTNIQEDSYSIFNKLSLRRTTKIDPLTLSIISRDLSIYLNSGISLFSSIKLINERYKKDKKLNTFFESLVTFLDEGKNFYTALEMQKIVILPEFYLHSIRISEDGGILPKVLMELADFLKEQDKLNKQISSAMAYPIFILIVSVFMVGFMLSFIVPKITAIFEQYNQELNVLASGVKWEKI